MAIAKTKNALKQRIERFFDSSNSARAEANDVLSSLSGVTDLYIFGGMIRDICLFGSKGFKSDIDIICNSDKRSLINALNFKNIIEINENKFGGFRISKLELDIDIWCINDTWAFKNDIIKFEDINSILSTTLMTWDSILYDFSNKKIICNDDYLKDLLSGRLELVLEKTPNEIGAIVKILRTIYGKHAQTLGQKAATMLKRAIATYTPKELILYESNSYSTKYLNIERIETISNVLDLYTGVGDISVTNFNQLPLDL